VEDEKCSGSIAMVLSLSTKPEKLDGTAEFRRGRETLTLVVPAII